MLAHTRCSPALPGGGRRPEPASPSSPDTLSADITRHLVPTLPGITRLSMPIRSFLSSCSFWKFSILIMVPCSCATISVISASAAEEGTQAAAYHRRDHQPSRMSLPLDASSQPVRRAPGPPHPQTLLPSLSNRHFLGTQWSAGWEEAQRAQRGSLVTGP